MIVEFDESTHQYLVDGVPVPSVTQLVAPLGADYDEPDDFLDIALDLAVDRGVTMHAYLAHRLQGGEAEDFEFPAVYDPYADAVELFLSEHDIVPYSIETPMPGDGFAGTPDLVCEFDGQTAIVDYKFVSQVAKSKVGAQLVGYAQLCEANGIYPDALYAVQFLKDGSYRLYPVGAGSHAAFEMCRTLYDLKNKKHPRGKID